MLWYKTIVTLLLSTVMLWFSCGIENHSSQIECTDNDRIKWKTIIDEEDRFRIKFPPCNILDTTEILFFQDQELEQRHLIVNLQGIESNCIAYSMSFHYLELAGDQIDDFLHVQGLANVESNNGVLEIEKRISDFPHAREFSYLLPHGLVLRQRTVFHNNMIYRWSVVTTKENRFQKSVTKFLNSFELLK